MWTRSDSNIPLNQLITALEKIREAAPGAASRNPKLGLAKTLELLKSSSAASVNALVSELESKKAKTTPARRSPPALRQALIERYSRDLQDAENHSVAAFEKLMSNLRSDTKVRVGELKKIVQEYTGDTSAFRKKDVGYGKIEQAFNYRWNLEHRM